MHRGAEVVPPLGCSLKSRPLTAPVVHSSPNNNKKSNNNVAATNSPVRKELGPSTRPALPRHDSNLPPGGLVHSRSGASLQRGSYDGKIAGLYDLEETLGRGHFAVVKLARHVFTGEKVAVKVIDKTKLDEVSRAHLFQEVRCMKLVQHPNVVRLYEVIDTQTKLYLILELADGGDLYDYIMRHEEGLVEDQARIYFRQIVNAISYCHKLHVVHRDLKPENVVFFERLGVVKLTDFGFSNRFDPGQKLETSCGSLAYSAPEILLGDSYDAPAVDVWSLGVILYMLVCGHAPFQEANDSETLTMIMDCKYSIPPYVSPACARLIGRMLVRAPERRASLEELSADPWLTAGASVSPGELEVPLVSRESLSEDDHTHILHKMASGKIATKEEILEALDKNEYNHITATYFLLAERKLRAQRQDSTQRSGMNNSSKPQLLPATPSPLLLSPGLVPLIEEILSEENVTKSLSDDFISKSNLSEPPAVMNKSLSDADIPSHKNDFVFAEEPLRTNCHERLLATKTLHVTKSVTESSHVISKTAPPGLFYLWGIGKPFNPRSLCTIS